MPDAGCERSRVRGQVEAGIIGVTPDFEVLGKIVVRIAIAVRADNPDGCGHATE